MIVGHDPLWLTVNHKLPIMGTSLFNRRYQTLILMIPYYCWSLTRYPLGSTHFLISFVSPPSVPRLRSTKVQRQLQNVQAPDAGDVTVKCMWLGQVLAMS